MLPDRRLSVPLFWVGAVALADLAFGVQLSLPAAVLVLCVLPVLYRAEWWHPLVPAASFLAAAPVASALGVGADLDTYAIVAIALVALSVFLLAASERRRLRSADG